MGYPMAQNILKAGFNLTAFNRTNEKAQGLSKNGAEVANSIKEVVEKSNIIITMLSDDDAVLSVICNKDFLENIKKKSIVIYPIFFISYSEVMYFSRLFSLIPSFICFTSFARVLLSIRLLCILATIFSGSNVSTSKF